MAQKLQITDSAINMNVYWPKMNKAKHRNMFNKTYITEILYCYISYNYAYMSE